MKIVAIKAFSLLCTLNIFAAINAQSISTFSPNKGTVGTLIKISGTNLINPSSVSIGGVSAIVISNNGISMVAMVMPGTISGKITITTVDGTAITTSNFTITPPAIPTVQQGDKLVGNEVLGISSQGNAVAVSADGNTAIVGGYTDNSYQGAV